MQNDVFNQISRFRAKRRQDLTEGEVKKISSLRSDKTHADEARIFILIILYLGTAYCAYTGFLFYQHTFGAQMDPFLAAVFSLGIAATVEIAKVKLTMRATRSVFFGWISRSWWDLGFWGIVSVLGICAYVWSVNISTDGQELLSRDLQDQRTEKPDLSKSMRNATADIDGQIANLQQNVSSSLQTKWHGVTTVEAQRIAKANSRSITTLQAQRAAIADQTMKDYNTIQGERSGRINVFSAYIRRYGGWVEFACFMSIMAIGFFERRLVDQFMSGQLDPADKNQNLNGNSQSDPSQNGEKAHFFNKSRLDGQVYSSTSQNTPFTAPISVSQCDTDIIPIGIMGADRVLSDCVTKIKRDLANIRNANGKPETVAGRIIDVIKDLKEKYIQDPGFSPSKQIATDAIVCFKDTQQALAGVGYNLKMESIFSALNRHVEPA